MADLTPAERKAIDNMRDSFAYLASERSSAERLGNHHAMAAYATALKLLDAGIVALEGFDLAHVDERRATKLLAHIDDDRHAMRRLGEIAWQRDIFGTRPRLVKAEGEAE